MKKIEMDQLLSSLNWRYAVKRYDPTKKISSQDWQTLEEVLRLSPSSYGLQPWKFLVIDSPELRKKLTPATWGQPQVEGCSHYVVLTTLRKIDEPYIDHYLKAIADTRGVAVATLDGFRKSMVGDLVNGPRAAVIQNWSQRQVYIAMGNIMNAAALLQIDTTPMEGLDPVKYDEILGLNGTPYATVAAVACGYRAADDQLQNAKKVRFPTKEVIQHI